MDALVRLIYWPVVNKRLGMEPVAGLGLCPRFRYEESMGFPSENQEQFGLTRHHFSLFSLTVPRICIRV